MILAFLILSHSPVIDHHVLSAGLREPHVYHVHCDKGDKHHITAEHGIPKDGVDISGRDPMMVTTGTPIQWWKIDGKARKVRE